MPDGSDIFRDLTYGLTDPFDRPLPRQDYTAIAMHAHRWARGTEAMVKWAEDGARCVNYYENKQWSDADRGKLERSGRPVLTINRIKPLVNLAVGYHLNNQTDKKVAPASDGTGVAATAEVLTHVMKNIAETNQEQFVDTEWYLDGILTGRGFMDRRMDFEKNAYGEVKVVSKDPFTIILDPDGDTYDPAEHNWIMEQRWIDLDAVAHYYGRRAAALVGPMINGSGIVGSMPYGGIGGSDIEQLAPWRTFAGGMNNAAAPFSNGYTWSDWTDPYRKTVRMVEIQHYQRTMRWHFTDLETGDRSPVPDDWGPERVQRAVQFARQNGQQIMLQNLPVKRLRTSHLVGDVMVYDDWSPYDTPTLIPFFPYFRRGQTRGMVEDLLGSQDEVNVRRSARLNIVGRSANSGWKVAKGSVDSRTAEQLRTGGGKPGLYLEFDTKGGTLPPPTEIQPSQSPVSIRELEHEAAGDLEYIAGINRAALGQFDGANTSGEALKVRQGGTVLGLEIFQKNYHRTQILAGRKDIALIQRFYTRERIVRVIGTNSTDPIEVTINQATADGIVNRVDIGRYDVSVKDQSMMDTFLAMQFDELMTMREKGIPVPASFIIDASSIGRKDELKLQIQAQEQAAAAAGIPPGGAPPGPAGAAAPPPGPMGAPAP